jgi:hypothetical protein
MSTNPTNVAAIPPQEEGAKKTKPIKILPTDRINPTKQLDILRAYAAASNNGTRPATVQEVADIMKMAVSTVALCNAFLASVGLIQRTDAGTYLPCSEVVSFLRAYEWNPETASHKLAPFLKTTWFAGALLSQLTFGPMDEELAIAKLAEACAAGPEYKKELQFLLEFLSLGGVIIRDGNQIRLAKANPTIDPPASKQEEPIKPSEPVRTPGRTVNTALNSSDGGVTFNVSVQVDMAEFATWRPDRIQAFFRGIAEVLAAKADVEKAGGNI